MTEFDNVRVEVEEGIARLVIDRPSKLNALNRATLEGLEAAFAVVQADDAVRAIVVTGEGDRAFVAGADIQELAEMTPLAAIEVARLGQRVFRAIELSRKPVIAAVNGFALGGGCELALACHLRIASETASFGLPEVGLGIIPGYGGTVRLPRIIGKGRALEMILVGDRVSAQEALDSGLVNRVVAPESLLEAATALAAKIAARGPVAVALAIESATRGMELDLDDALALEANLFGILASTDDMREGMSAFLEKRRPEFRGR